MPDRLHHLDRLDPVFPLDGVYMIHLRPTPAHPRKRCDTRALRNARAEIHRQLRAEIDEIKMDARMPRHFLAREHFRKFGETAQ